MPVQVKQAGRLRRHLQSELLQAAGRRIVAPFEKDLKALLIQLHEETLVGWRGETKYSGKNGSYTVQQWEKPRIEVETRIVRRDDNLAVEVKVYVLRDDGEAHNLWYWLDHGTADITWPGSGSSDRSAAFFPVNERTGAFSQSSRKSYAFRPVVIERGKRRRGIQARGWSERIAQQVATRLARNELGQGWLVSYSTVKRPALARQMGIRNG